MKYEFRVTFDSDTRQWYIEPLSDNVDIPHSGSSYLRIKPNDRTFSGTIGTHAPYETWSNGKEPPPDNYWLQFHIDMTEYKVKKEKE